MLFYSFIFKSLHIKTKDHDIFFDVNICFGNMNTLIRFLIVVKF